LVIVCALLVGAVAPARAWCEATCLAPAEQRESHCRTSDPADGTTSVSANLLDECPVLESARPSVAVRLEMSTAPIAAIQPVETARTTLSPNFVRAHCATTVFQRSVPLRI
jgi:hypothetical protein